MMTIMTQHKMLTGPLMKITLKIFAESAERVKYLKIAVIARTMVKITFSIKFTLKSFDTMMKISGRRMTPMKKSLMSQVRQMKAMKKFMIKIN